MLHLYNFIHFLALHFLNRFSSNLFCFARLSFKRMRIPAIANVQEIETSQLQRVKITAHDRIATTF